MDIIIVDHIRERVYSTMHEVAGKGQRMINALNKTTNGSAERYGIRTMNANFTEPLPDGFYTSRVLTFDNILFIEYGENNS